MRIFFAGASGVLGRHLLPLLIDAGHTVGAMTRSHAKVPWLTATGAQPIVCDVFDRAALTRAVESFSPGVVLHELTDLPDDSTKLPEAATQNARIRREGTENLLAAMEGLSTPARIVAQSIAWDMPPGVEADAVAYLEKNVLAAGGVILRYGFFYGPGTYFENELPPAPRVRIDRAAVQTIASLQAPPGVLTVVDEDPR